jgi:hypothetical protein
MRQQLRLGCRGFGKMIARNFDNATMQDLGSHEGKRRRLANGASQDNRFQAQLTVWGPPRPALSAN